MPLDRHLVLMSTGLVTRDKDSIEPGPTKAAPTHGDKVLIESDHG